MTSTVRNMMTDGSQDKVQPKPLIRTIALFDTSLGNRQGSAPRLLEEKKKAMSTPSLNVAYHNNNTCNTISICSSERSSRLLQQFIPLRHSCSNRLKKCHRFSSPPSGCSREAPVRQTDGRLRAVRFPVSIPLSVWIRH